MPNQNNNQPPLTYWQRREAEKLAEAKKRRNILMSRRSGEIGGTAYKTSKTSFAGGEVESRSRVSLVGKNTEGEVGRSAVGKVRSKLGFAKGAPGSQPTGFAKGEARASATGAPLNKLLNRPPGFGKKI